MAIAVIGLFTYNTLTLAIGLILFIVGLAIAWEDENGKRD